MAKKFNVSNFAKVCVAVSNTIKSISSIKKPNGNTPNNDYCKGRHLIVDARNVPIETLQNSKKVIKALVAAVEKAGANVLSTNRHDFGLNSPPGFAMTICSRTGIIRPEIEPEFPVRG